MDKKTARCIELQDQGLVGDELIKKLCLEFDVSVFAADWIVKDADAQRRRKANTDVQGIDKHIELRKRLLEDALADDDREMVLKTLQDLGKLTGAYNETEDKKIEIEFLFPAAVGYHPLNREVIEKALEFAKQNKVDNENNNTIPTAS